jgi:hypothetical protein
MPSSRFGLASALPPNRLRFGVTYLLLVCAPQYRLARGTSWSPYLSCRAPGGREPETIGIRHQRAGSGVRLLDLFCFQSTLYGPQSHAEGHPDERRR